MLTINNLASKLLKLQFMKEKLGPQEQAALAARAEINLNVKAMKKELEEQSFKKELKELKDPSGATINFAEAVNCTQYRTFTSSMV